MWSGAKEKRKISLIKWDVVCLSKSEGGSGLQKLEFQNLALGAKLSWKMFKCIDEVWCKLMWFKYLDDNDPYRILTIANSEGGPLVWRFMWDSREIITNHLKWKFGNGKKAKLWLDLWNEENALVELLNSWDWVAKVERTHRDFIANYVRCVEEVMTILEWILVEDFVPPHADRQGIILELQKWRTSL
ncbi:hypothetical protein SUGI_0324070 [Cryptomeria japonica]|nr:hypothetical protein SUGI_0324070 [Cryptomeria japonica]